MTLRGTGFVPGSTVMWNGKKFSSSYVSSKQMTVYVPKAAVAAHGHGSGGGKESDTGRGNIDSREADDKVRPLFAHPTATRWVGFLFLKIFSRR